MRTLISKTLRGLALSGGLALAALLSAGTAAAVTVEMTASQTALTMPDGNSVDMWGYNIDAIDGDTGFATIPFGPTGVPVLHEVAGNPLTINLTNNLTVPTSVVIPGQKADSLVPTWTDASTGDRTALTQRVQSFTNETAGAGGTGIYTWSTLEAGTYLIHSGTQPGLQVPMGLYAVLIVDELAGPPAWAYDPPGATEITYDQEVVLLFSEVDSQQHLAVAAGTYGTPDYPTTMAAGYEADYFLVNGRPWGPDSSPFSAGTEGSTTLLRFLNAGIRDRVPVLQKELLSVVAEDGKPFTTVGGLLQQYTLHSVELPPLKTMDAIFAPATAGYYPVSDRRLGLTNGNNGPGGMLAYLQVEPAAPTTWTLTAAIDGVGTGSVQMSSAPGGINFANFVGGGSDATEAILAGTMLTLSGTPEPDTGSALTGWAVSTGPEAGCLDPYGDCVITMDADKTVTATFTTFANVTVLTPNGGEGIPSGSGYTVRWGAPATAVNFTLAYSLGAGSPWQVIATGVTGNSYVWAVPDSVPNSGSIYVAVVGYDAAGNQVGLVDVSDNAALRSSVALLTPSAAGIILPNGVPYDLTWSTSLISGNIASIGLWYQTAPGTPWQFITSLGGAATSYSWSVPNSPTSEAKVGVIFYDSTGTPLHMDVSDNMFEIQ